MADSLFQDILKFLNQEIQERSFFLANRASMVPDLRQLWLRATTDPYRIPITAPWATKDIVYVSVVGSIMVAAVLEWTMWLLAFLYCLLKVYQKAEGEQKWSIRILAIVNMLFFMAMRLVFLPIMIVTLPLPSRFVQYFPVLATQILQDFAFYSFAGLLIVPWLFCVFSLVTHSVGRTRRIKTVLDEYSAPKVVIIMPCYNEEPDVLLRTIHSIVDCDYPPSCMHIFLSFDGDAVNDLFLNTIEKLDVPLSLDFAKHPSIDVTYRGSRITVSRFPHGGKRHCQKKSFKLIDKIYAEYLRRNDNLFLLFIDSDCILDKVCIQNFLYEMELKPGSKRNSLAMTGVITSTSERNKFITVLQDMEYIHGQLFERSVESSLGAVTCLPGALTMLRFSAFRRMSKYYFADKAEQCDDMFDFGKCHLGEDRWLTHLFMIGAKERYQIQMNTGAFCKTEAVQGFRKLLKQRRRWFLGFITNEVCMLTDIRLWKRYPLLCLLRLAQNTIRTTALLFFIMLFALMSTEETVHNLPVEFIGVSLGLNWLLMIYFGAKLGRYKIMLYPLMFIVNPFMNWLYMVYGIFTCGQRTWGGPRADAGKADANTTPEQVIEKAAQAGDELNVVPETFKPAVQAQHRMLHRVPLLPSGRLQGRFAAPEILPGGFFQQENDSGTLYSDMAHRDIEGMVGMKEWRRDSTDTFWSTSSIALPRRVESLFVDDGVAIPRRTQQRSRSTSREHAWTDLDRVIMSNSDGVYGPYRAYRPRAPSFESRRSEDSAPMHFNIPEPYWTLPQQSQPTATRASNIPAQPTASARPRRHSSPPPASVGLGRRNSFDTPVAGPSRRSLESALEMPANATERQTSRLLMTPQNSAHRTGSSPLARKSFERVASPPREDDIGTPMDASQVMALERESARRASEEAERRGRRSSVGRRPRKLSKQRPGGSSRDSSKD